MKTFLIAMAVLVVLAGVVFGLFYPYLFKCGQVITFGDGFNSGTLEPSLWANTYPSGNGGEQQYYSPAAVQVIDHTLNISATPVQANGYSYTSGIILTKGKFAQEYGRFEIKARLPKGKGFWPAFWLLPATTDFPVEIDVFEMHGDDTHTIYMSLHWKGSDGSHQHITIPYTSAADLSVDFHTYTLDWTAYKLTWSIDGKQIYTTSEHIPHEPMFFLANLAVGGRWPGYPDASTPFPGVMQILSARVSVQVCSLSFADRLILPFIKR